MGELFERLESFIKEDTQFGGKLVVKRERKKTFAMRIPAKQTYMK